ncbi:MAG: hypothetical protein UX80_C0031G0003 [Candidatus Amesbacteria bacterium GW2011_GWA2_47_11b]|uniref:Uncharacterized protein n=1 Tax=Candidatus Amesbacteria bacterium GW2011_GWA2_47_11b TaxID=1618358 RepID=A0A0G1RIB3_9BACT|nr:MAG: hypothetical protein UX80_C0031G0003 [Candidatus Amesbacteria bacterium GW2011_GWA2_47_11b]
MNEELAGEYLDKEGEKNPNNKRPMGAAEFNQADEGKNENGGSEKPEKNVRNGGEISKKDGAGKVQVLAGKG